MSDAGGNAPQGRVAVHFVECRADPLDERQQRVEVDAVHLGRGEAEDATGLVFGDVA